MNGKITLITSPDIFENESLSLFFAHLDDEDQEKVTSWFSNSTVDQDVNIYFLDKESDMPWILHAMAKSNFRFINLDELSETTKLLSGYILGKSNTFYKTKSENAAAICYYINQNRITNIESFLGRVFNDKNGS